MFWNASFRDDTKKPADQLSIQPARFSAIDGQKPPSISGQAKAAVTLDLTWISNCYNRRFHNLDNEVGGLIKYIKEYLEIDKLKKF